MREAITAAELLDKDLGVTADVWSCPGFNELARDAERYNRLNPEAKAAGKPYITELLEGRQGPAYIRIYPEQVRAFVPMCYTVLGTDGFGRSDTAPTCAATSKSTVTTSRMRPLRRWRRKGGWPARTWRGAIKQYKIDVEKPHPWGLIYQINKKGRL